MFNLIFLKGGGVNVLKLFLTQPSCSVVPVRCLSQLKAEHVETGMFLTLLQTEKLFSIKVKRFFSY